MLHDAIQGLICLSDKKPLFENGNHRAVYAHPDNPDLLIKIIRPRWHERYENHKNWKSRYRPWGAHTINLVEFAESMRNQLDTKHRQPHLFTPLGLVRTDIGWGLMCEMEKGKDGNPAPSLEDLLPEIGQYKQAFRDFASWIRTTKAVITSVKPANTVMAWRNGQPEIMIIDGMGDRRAVPVRLYFQRFNRKENIKRLHKLLHDCGLDQELAEEMKF